MADRQWWESDPIASDAPSAQGDWWKSDPVAGDAPGPELSDFGNALQVGMGQAGQSVGYLLKKVGADNLGQSVQDYWAGYSKEQQGQFSEGAKQALSKDMSLDDISGSLTKAGLIGLESVPGMVMTAPLGMGAGAAAGGVARALAARGIGGSLTAAAAGAAAPTTLATRIAAATPGAVGAGVAEGVQAGASNAAQAEQQVMDMPIDQLRGTPGWADAVKAAGGNEEKARAALAKTVGDYNFTRSAIATGTLSALMGGGVLGQMVNRQLGTEAAKGILRSALSGAGREAIEEAPQNASDQLIQNLGQQKFIDPDQPTWQGVGQQAIEGAVVGGLMGGVTGGTDSAVSRMTPRGKTSVPERTDPILDDAQQSATAAQEGSGPHVEVSFPGAPVQPGAATGAPAPGDTGRAPGDPTARLQQLDAIAQQRDLTPEESSEVNSLLGGQEQGSAAPSELTPESDLALMGMQPETPASPAQASPTLGDMQTQQPAQPVPPPQDPTVDAGTSLPAIKGAPTQFSTDAGGKLDGQYALVDAGSLVTSHDENLRVNPAFPQELQPRARDRAASELQISGIVQKIDPARLGLSADAATGAPIIGPDGIVESGNARTIALKRIYQANGQKAQDYKAFLRDNAEAFGINPQDVDKLQQPVLVRLRTSDVDRAEFARQANSSTVAQMSPSEQARSDAARVDSLDGLNPDDSGDFTNAASRDFIRSFMSKLPATEQAGMVDAQGNLSTAGYARVRNAVLAKAYGDSPTLQRMTESLDDNLRNVSRALLRVAPTVAKARSAIQSGDLFDADLAPHLLGAVDEFSKLKDQGIPVRAALDQMSMFGEDMHPIARDMLQFLDENIRRPNKIAALIQSYYTHLAAAGHPAQQGLLGDTAPPTVGDILTAAKADLEKDSGQDRQQTSLFEQPAAGKRPAGGNQETRAADEQQRSDAQGHARGAKGDGLDSKRQAAEVSNAPPQAPSEESLLAQARKSIPKLKRALQDANTKTFAAGGFTFEQDGRFTKVLHQGEQVASISGRRTREAIARAIKSNLDDAQSRVKAAPPKKAANDARGPLADTAKAKEKAKADFMDALADLAQIASKHTRAAMIPEDTPGLMPTLVRLFDAAIRIVGSDMKAALKYVKEQMRANAATKPLVNSIAPQTFQKAALQALEQQGTNDLLSGAEAPRHAMIDGRAYDMARDNFKPPEISSFIPESVLSKVREQLSSLRKSAMPTPIGDADRIKAEAMLRPIIERADAVKADYDQKIIDIAKNSGALGQILAPIKSLESASRKLVNKVGFDAAKIYDLIRSTIVVKGYGDAQSVIDAIREKFEVIRIKNMTDASIDGHSGRYLDSGYGQVLLNVKLPDGLIAEIQINVPQMLAAKMAYGHALYEIERTEKIGSEARARAVASQREIYPLAAAAAARSSDSLDGFEPKDSGKSRIGVNDSVPDSSSSMNTRPSGNLTNSVASPSVPNSQPSGNFSGIFISDTSNSIVGDDLLRRAQEFAAKQHAGQKRAYTDEDYITHPQAVADVVRSVPHTPGMLAASWLHDTVEDTGATLDDVREQFGDDVARLVEELTKIDLGDKSASNDAALDRLRNASSEAQTVKLADIIHNLSNLRDVAPAAKAKGYIEQKARQIGVLTKGDPSLKRLARALVDGDTQAYAEHMARALVREIASARPHDDFDAVRLAARDAVREKFGERVVTRMQSGGNAFAPDGLTEETRAGMYSGVQKEAESLPVPVYESDIPEQDAVAAFSNMSHFPERGARRSRRGYVTALVDAWRSIKPAQGDPPSPELVEAFREMVNGYRSRVMAYLHAQARVASPMIVGPARFPVAANEKRGRTADLRWNEAQSYLSAAVKRLQKYGVQKIEQSPLQEAQSELQMREKLQERMKAANAIIRKGGDTKQALRDLGLDDAEISNVTKPDFAGYLGYAPYRLTNNLSTIKRLRQRVRELEKAQSANTASADTASPYEGVRIEENAADDRLRLFFNDKPSEALRADLRGSGFLWSPKAGAWQRKLTDNARRAAKSILNRHMPKRAAAAAPALSRSVPASTDMMRETPLIKGSQRTQLFSALAKFDDAFKYATPKAHTLTGIVNEIDPAYRVQDKSASFASSQTKGKANKAWEIFVPGSDVRSGYVYESQTGNIWIDVSSLQSNKDAGSKVYAMVSAYAHNTGKVFVGDPSGLSPIAFGRRLENMISSALKYSTTDHLYPHAAQIDPRTYYRDVVESPEFANEIGDLALHWKDGDTAHNLAEMLRVSYALHSHFAPEIKSTVYDFDKQQFVNADTGEVRPASYFRDLSGRVSGGGQARYRAGSATLARAALVNTLVRGEGTQEWRHIVAALRDQLSRRRLDPALHSIFYSRGADTVGPDVSRAQDVADRMRSGWANSPDIVVVRDLQDKFVPQAVRDYDAQQRSQGATGEPEGFFYKGKAYIVASQMHSAADVVRVLAHEVLGHAGLRGKFGAELDGVLDQIVVSRRADVLAKAKQYGLGTSKADLQTAAEEVLAELAQTQPQVGFVRRAIAAIRTWLRAQGLNLRLSDDEIIRNFILPARAYIERGAGKAAGGDPVMLRASDPGVQSMADDSQSQIDWLNNEARAAGFADIDALADAEPDMFMKLAAKWREQNPAEALMSRQGVAFSRAQPIDQEQAPDRDPAKRAQQIINTPAATPAPVERVAQTISRAIGLERAANAAYNKGAQLLDMLVPERVKAGVVSDYGVPEAVIDRRSAMMGEQRAKLRETGRLVDKLATLTRAESRVAYAWMNESDSKLADALMKDLPDESVAVLRQVRDMIDGLSREAVRLGQLSQEAYEAHKFAYLKRSYRKHIDEMESGDRAARSRTLAILGDQYKGRGIVLKAGMAQMQAAAPAWWGRKLKVGAADLQLKGERFIRFEKRAPSGEGTAPIDGMADKPLGKLQQVAYWPAGEPVPARFKEWSPAGIFQVRDVKGGDVVLWRDFSKQERERMGEIDEARFAIARTLHGMIHDVEVGRYMEWLANKHSKATPADVDGPIVDASERYRDAFTPGEWVQVPAVKIPGTSVAKYGALAGRYLPGPIWNDLRQTVGGQFRPFGQVYSKILSAWKTSKTALSPAVHLNNVMSNFVMADWHDVTAGHVAKALRILLAAQGKGQGALGRAGNALGKMGLADAEAARKIVNRYTDSGGDIGTWATNELAREQLQPLLAAAEEELAQAGPDAYGGQTGVYAALQHALHLKFPDAWQAFKASKPVGAVATEAKNLMALYQAEDDVFRLAAWLRAKEQGASDLDAGKAARRSFLDYRINAPWVQVMRNSVFPFVSYTYRAVPMLLDVIGHKPHKLLKLMTFAGAVNALGVMIGGGGDDRERKLLPDEKAGNVWGIVPKLIRMPWNDANGSPVYMDIRRFVPLGDVVDVGQGHAALPLLPTMYPGGPLATLGELVFNRSLFTGQPITKETDTPTQRAGKVADYLYKSMAPNLIGVPGTYATQNVVNAMSGKTDAFGRQQSVAQAMASSFGVKLGSYPADVLRQQAVAKFRAQQAEIQMNMSKLKRQRMLNAISDSDYRDQVLTEQTKLRKLSQELQEKLAP